MEKLKPLVIWSIVELLIAGIWLLVAYSDASISLITALSVFGVSSLFKLIFLALANV
ncbi:MAG TPA: hypothetical protein VJB94_01200 [Candidatus Nanoarchaeia archaeon]|nr:hypothetical protein [Candidatus Nanoarchaeia archaeon]